MKGSILIAFLLSVSSLLSYAQGLEKGPWYDHHVNGINRLEARATSYSYASAEDALACDREASRIKSLRRFFLRTLINIFKIPDLPSLYYDLSHFLKK